MQFWNPIFFTLLQIHTETSQKTLLLLRSIVKTRTDHVKIFGPLENRTCKLSLSIATASTVERRVTRSIVSSLIQSFILSILVHFDNPISEEEDEEEKKKQTQAKIMEKNTRGKASANKQRPKRQREKEEENERGYRATINRHHKSLLVDDTDEMNWMQKF